MKAKYVTKTMKNQFGDLDVKYNFSLNPYPTLRFSKCSICEGKTGQRKLPLVIHIDPGHFIALNYSNRYCQRCDSLIGHKHQIEHLLTDLFSQLDPSVIGNDYLIIGTAEKKAWRKGLSQLQFINEMVPHIHDFKSYKELRMTMAGWFHKDQEPPVWTPPLSTEWVKS